jgi:hypothetical protein
VLQVIAADQDAGQGELAPEGLAHVEQHFLASALENNGSVVLFELLE